ncbi:MAG: phospholipid carrier-dependent glycosyltransferase [bacterium]
MSLSFGLGLGVLSILVLLIGFAKGLNRFCLYSVLLMLCIISIREIKYFFSRLKSSFSERFSKEIISQLPYISAFSKFLIISIGVTMFLAFTGALAPPLNYDTLSYHLAFPKLYVRAGKIFFIPHNMYSNLPFGVEMLYTLALVIKDGILAKLIHFSIGILCALTIFVLGRKYFDGNVGLLAAAIFYNMPAVCLSSTYAFNDLGLVFYGLLMLFCILNWSNGFATPKNEIVWLILAGIFCGFAIGTKYTGALYFIPTALIFIVAFIVLKKEKVFKNTCRSVLLFIFFASLTFSPWLIKNLIYTHNPVYPLFYSIFGGIDWNRELVQRFARFHISKDMNVLHIVSLLWKLPLNNQGSGILLILPVLFFTKLNRNIKVFISYTALVFILWIFFTHRIIRFLLPCLSVWSLLAAYTLVNFKKSKIISIGLHAFVIGFLCWNTFKFAATVGFNFFDVAYGKVTKEEFLSKNFYQYGAFKFINERLPENSKILFVGENQSFYCDRDYVGSSPLDVNDIVEISNASENASVIYDKLRDMDITHILYNASEVKRVSNTYRSFNWKQGAEARFSEFMARFTTCLYSKKGVFLLGLI